MATHTQIIEFFGLPGCGKSTLCDNLLGEQVNDDMVFCKMNTVSVEYRKLCLFRKFRFFPYNASILLFYLILKSGFSSKNFRIYKSFFSIIIIYAFCKHTKSYRYMLIDHGVIQSVVSLFYGSKPERFKSSINIVNRLIDVIGIDHPIYCDISVRESISRMRKRNRLDSGRLDAIRDDIELEAIMVIQGNQFKDILPDHNLKRIDMLLPVSQCRIDLLNLIEI